MKPRSTNDESLSLRRVSMSIVDALMIVTGWTMICDSVTEVPQRATDKSNTNLSVPMTISPTDTLRAPVPTHYYKYNTR